MDCLIDFIGIRNVGTAPESGLFINDLPGISLKQINAMANTEQVDFAGVWRSVQNRSAKIFETAFTNFMGTKYRLKKITESFQLSSTVDTTLVIPAAAGTLRGIFIDCYYLKSPFHYIPINKVHLYLGDIVPTDPFPLYVYEVHDNKLTLLDTLTVTPEAGWNDISINKKYADSAILYIAYDASTVDSVSLKLDSIDLNSHFWASYNLLWSHLYIEGASYFNNQFQKGYNTFGLTATIGLQCSFDILVCNYKNELAMAWWYLLGAELLQERIYSDRINRYTTIDAGKAKDLRRELLDNYKNELATFVDSINLNSDWCIECDAPVKRATALP